MQDTNYLNEAVDMLSVVNASGSPRIAKQVTWGRVVNTYGGRGRNVPVDLHMEHLNRSVKEYVVRTSQNRQFCSVDVASKAFKVCAVHSTKKQKFTQHLAHTQRRAQKRTRE